MADSKNKKNGKSTSTKKAEGGDDKKNTQMPPVRKFEARANRIAEWVNTLTKKADRFESAELNEALKTANESIRGVVSVLVELPDDCGVKTRSSGGKAFAIGATVDIKDRARESYEDLLPPEDLVGLEVIKISKGKVAVMTPGGARMFLPKAHLVPAAAAQQ